MLLPYYKILSLFDFETKIKPFLSLPSLTSNKNILLNNSYDLAVVVDTTMIYETKNVSTIEVDFLPYLLMAGSWYLLLLF